jgi:hypothetical protein
MPPSTSARTREGMEPLHMCSTNKTKLVKTCFFSAERASILQAIGSEPAASRAALPLLSCAIQDHTAEQRPSSVSSCNANETLNAGQPVTTAFF